MLPTLYAHDNWVVADKCTHRLGRVWQRGDVVFAISPIEPSKAVAKRIVGLPGDVVKVFPERDDTAIHVPKGHVWLTGDNLSNSTDSRAYGPVPIALLRGRILGRIWPDPCMLTQNKEDVH
jgi:signal peptidase I